MTDQNGVLVEEQSEDITRKMSQLATESPKNQLQILTQLAEAGEGGLTVLRDFLLARRPTPVNLVTGKAYQLLYQDNSAQSKEFLANYFPTGVVPLDSAKVSIIDFYRNYWLNRIFKLPIVSPVKNSVN